MSKKSLKCPCGRIINMAGGVWDDQSTLDTIENVINSAIASLLGLGMTIGLFKTIKYTISEVRKLNSEIITTKIPELIKMTKDAIKEKIKVLLKIPEYIIDSVSVGTVKDKLIRIYHDIFDKINTTIVSPDPLKELIQISGQLLFLSTSVVALLEAYKKFISKKGGKYADISEFKTIKISNGNLTGGSLEDNKDNQDESPINNFLNIIGDIGNGIIAFLNSDEEDAKKNDNKYQEAKNIAENLIKKVKKNDNKYQEAKNIAKKLIEKEKNNNQKENNNQEAKNIAEKLIEKEKNNNQEENNNQEVNNNQEEEEENNNEAEEEEEENNNEAEEIAKKLIEKVENQKTVDNSVSTMGTLFKEGLEKVDAVKENAERLITSLGANEINFGENVMEKAQSAANNAKNLIQKIANKKTINNAVSAIETLGENVMEKAQSAANNAKNLIPNYLQPRQPNQFIQPNIAQQITNPSQFIQPNISAQQFTNPSQFIQPNIASSFNNPPQYVQSNMAQQFNRQMPYMQQNMTQQFNRQMPYMQNNPLQQFGNQSQFMQPNVTQQFNQRQFKYNDLTTETQ
jgi:hypothetical protein